VTDTPAATGNGDNVAVGSSESAEPTTGPVKSGNGTAGSPAAKRALKPEPKPSRPSVVRTRILPRSILGIASLILALAVGAGFSGVVLFSYYQYKQNQTNQRVNTLINGYKQQFVKAEGDLGAAVAAAKANIQTQLNAVQQLQSSPAALASLIKRLAPSVMFVHTLDANGQPSVGTAFVISSSPAQSLLLTSYTTVAAATHAPGPPVYVRQANADIPVTVRSWDPQYDLALLILTRGNLPAIAVAPPSPAPEPGQRIFSVSGLGSVGASAVQGSVIDVSSSGLAVDTAIGTAFQGGPLVNANGEVLAVASRTYSPLGFSSDGVWYAPYVQAACNKVLTCPGGTLAGSH
jgi:S1-C subfamily serine protease